MTSMESGTTRSAAAPASTDRATHKIVVRGVEKSFTRRGETLAVLERMDLHVDRGEFVCILGPSGCGKTTLLNIIGGFDTPTTGSVEIDGELVHGPDSRRVFVFQEYGIFPWATVWDNIALGLRRRTAVEQDKIISRYVELVGLEGFERTYPAELSGGMKQRVAVARALAVSPDVICMDEPLGALDSLTRLQMRGELLRIWKQEKPTILFVTHDVDEALQLADRIVIMSPRPARILEEVRVGLDHPRDVASAEYGRLKRRLYERLGVSAAI
jgi:ABC-type nitrate/sulfonate/bicarbonate transport system ATPase subunit